MEHMLKVGLTGGIGSGKSTVARYFAALGVPVIDCDVIAKDLVQPGTKVLAQIVEHFGDKIVNAKGELKRSYLRQIVFNTVSERTWLEGLLHPLIWQEIASRLAQLQAVYCIIIIPLLLEASWQKHVDKILVVDAKETTQIARLMQRDHVTLVKAKTSLHNQASRQQRLQAADDVIHNDGSLQNLQEQVVKLHQKYVT
jgi:dephospho-CoA kinase